MVSIRYQRFPPGQIAAMESSFEFSDQNAVARVSCLMVTRGNMQLVSHAYRMFKAQSWPNKELVVVSGGITDELRALAARDGDIVLVEAPGSLSLGELRNISIARSCGDFVCQWDDDDLYDPNRIAVMMGVLVNANVSAVFVERMLLWWPARGRLCISHPRMWEGSMLAHRSAVAVYPAMTRSEDSVAVNWMARNHAVALLDCPELYCYRVTGQNTWNEAHFEKMFDGASRTFAREEFAGLFKLACFEGVAPGL